MTARTEAMDALIAQDADLIDVEPVAWMPIETAPQNTDVLVCVTYNVPGEEHDPRPPADDNGYVWETAMWVDCLIDGRSWFVFPHLIHIPFTPTHWQPLPPAPGAVPLYTRPPVDAALLDEVRGALVSIQEYWNRDYYEAAMANACWHAIETATAALAKLEGLK